MMMEESVQHVVMTAIQEVCRSFMLTVREKLKEQTGIVDVEILKRFSLFFENFFLALMIYCASFLFLKKSYI